MALSEVNAVVNLVVKATSFIAQLQDGWYKGSVELETLQTKLSALRARHGQWNEELPRERSSEDKYLLPLVEESTKALDNFQGKVEKLQKSSFRLLKKKVFPGQIFEIVEAGPQSLAVRGGNHGILAQTPVSLPFGPDSNYVPIADSILAVRNTLENSEGPRVVTVHGGPGMGKSSLMKFLAIHYQEEHKRLGADASFPHGVYCILCEQHAEKRVNQLLHELLQNLGYGTRSVPVDGSTPSSSGSHEGDNIALPTNQMQLRSRLAEQKLLIMVDDVWEAKKHCGFVKYLMGDESGARKDAERCMAMGEDYECLKHRGYVKLGDIDEAFLELLVPAKGVKYLVTSQIRDIRSTAAPIQITEPTLPECCQIMANYNNKKGEFPDNIKSVAEDIIRLLQRHPLSLANIGISVKRSRATDIKQWNVMNGDFSNNHLSTGNSDNGVSDPAPASLPPHAIIESFIDSKPSPSSRIPIAKEEDITRLTEDITRLTEEPKNHGQYLCLVVNNRNDIPALLERLEPDSNLPGSRVLHKRIEIGQTGNLWKDFLSSEVIENMKLAKTYDKDCTMQLGSVAVLKHTDVGLKCWMLQKDWTPVILDLHRSPRSFLHLLNDDRPKWTVRGFNLENAILRVATTESSKEFTIFNYHKIDDGVEELSFEEPCIFRMFSNKVYISASNTVQLEGVDFKLYSEARKVRGAFWISVLDSLIPILWTVFLIASLLLVGGFAFPTRNEFFTAAWFAAGFPVGFSVFLLLREFAPLKGPDVMGAAESTAKVSDPFAALDIMGAAESTAKIRDRSTQVSDRKKQRELDVDPNHGSTISSEDRRNTITVTPAPAIRNREEEGSIMPGNNWNVVGDEDEELVEDEANYGPSTDSSRVLLRLDDKLSGDVPEVENENFPSPIALGSNLIPVRPSNLWRRSEKLKVICVNSATVEKEGDETATVEEGDECEPYAEVFFRLDSAGGADKVTLKLAIDQVDFGVKKPCSRDCSARYRPCGPECETAFMRRIIIQIVSKIGTEVLAFSPISSTSKQSVLQRSTQTALAHGFSPARQAGSGVVWEWAALRYASGKKLKLDDVVWGRKPDLPFPPDHLQLHRDSFRAEAEWELEPHAALQSRLQLEPLEFDCKIILHTAVLKSKRVLGLPAYSVTTGPIVPFDTVLTFYKESSFAAHVPENPTHLDTCVP